MSKHIIHLECDSKNCEFIAKSKPDLNKHKLNHQNGYQFFCKNCRSKFKLEKDLLNHKEKGCYIVCKECNKRLKPKTLKSHMDIVHFKIKTHHCYYELCDKSFYHKSQLITHINTIHKSNYKYTCIYCKVGYNNLNQLNNHMIKCKFKTEIKTELQIVLNDRI